MIGLALLLAMSVVEGIGPGLGVATAQTPSLIATPIGGGFSGVPPRLGGVGLLVTTETSSAAGLASTLRDAGCATVTVSSVGAGTWSSYVTGAPAFVNEEFPALLAADTPFAVRCLQVTPLVDPRNATYGLDGGAVALTDGGSAIPAAPGSATQILTEVTTRQSYAFLDGDTVADAATVLTYQPGGSGTFSYLSVVGTAAGGAAPTVFLGDRVIVERLAAAHGAVTVTYLDRAPGQPFAATPTVPVTRRFKLEGGALVELGSGACEVSNLDALGSFVFVTSPIPGAQLFSGFAVTGCSRTFESTVNWRLLARNGAVLASGFTTGSGVDDADRFAFTVTYTHSGAAEVGSLEVFEVDASAGEGLPPPRVVVPIVLP
ncbi:MAG: Gmad2 immunoglobulin-like domain-containing protein [Chloroflexi bacterium]|nr:Gmad2 immunoglobulin-like domain-containing protein [Chloroflexota bacterium]MDA1147949.1 Gmad2 immunoglobulin-like domain-containing protein [Chloroflexota bacterium]